MDKAGQLPHRPAPPDTAKPGAALDSVQCTSRRSGRSSLVLCTFVDIRLPFKRQLLRIDMNFEKTTVSLAEFELRIRQFCLAFGERDDRRIPEKLSPADLFARMSQPIQGRVQDSAQSEP